MAIGDAYATPSQYRAVLDKTDTGEDAEIAEDLLAVSRYLDRALGRFFSRDTAPQARVYVVPAAGRPWPGWAEAENPWRYGGLVRVLYIDDLVSVSSVAVDQDRDGTFETTLAPSDYELLPRDAALRPEPEPYTAIELLPWGSLPALSPGMRVRVEGIWGWPSVPMAVQRATIHLTGILRLESPRAQRQLQAGLETAIETSREAQSIVQELVRHYRRVQV